MMACESFTERFTEKWYFSVFTEKWYFSVFTEKWYLLPNVLLWIRNWDVNGGDCAQAYSFFHSGICSNVSNHPLSQLMSTPLHNVESRFWFFVLWRDNVDFKIFIKHSLSHCHGRWDDLISPSQGGYSFLAEGELVIESRSLFGLGNSWKECYLKLQGCFCPLIGLQKWVTFSIVSSSKWVIEGDCLTLQYFLA